MDINQLVFNSMKVLARNIVLSEGQIQQDWIKLNNDYISLMEYFIKPELIRGNTFDRTIRVFVINYTVIVKSTGKIPQISLPIEITKQIKLN